MFSEEFAFNFCFFCSKAAETNFVVYEDVSTHSIATWQSKCVAKGGLLASIKSAEDQKKIEEALKKTKKRTVMVGVHRDPNNLKYFINLDGTPVSFT